MPSVGVAAKGIGIQPEMGFQQLRTMEHKLTKMETARKNGKTMKPHGTAWFYCIFKTQNLSWNPTRAISTHRCEVAYSTADKCQQEAAGAQLP